MAKRQPAGTNGASERYGSDTRRSGDVPQTLETFGGFTMGRGILLWLLGVPIPVIIIIMLLFR